MSTTATHDLARRIVALSQRGADVASGDFAAAQSQLAGLGVDLARLVLAEPEPDGGGD